MLKHKSSWILLLLFIIFFAIEFPAMNRYDISDHNIYFYSARLVADGNIPYKDFFLSHPPVQILLLAGVYKIFGFNIFILKLVPFLAIIGSAFLLYLMMKERFGTITALMTASLFLFSFLIVEFGSFALGVNLTAFFIVLGIYLLHKKKHIASGLAYAVAALTGLYAAPIIAGVIIALFFGSKSLESKKNFYSFLISFLIAFGALNLIFLIIAGQNYISQVYLYHLYKKTVASSKVDVVLDVIKNNIPMLIASLSIIFVKEKKPMTIYMIMSVFFLIFLALISRIFPYYFVIFFTVLAIIGGFSIEQICKQWPKYSKYVYIGLLLLLAIGLLLKAEHLMVLFHPFGEAENMADYVRAHTEPDDELFGESVVVPLIALLAERDIALHQADTNTMVFQSKIVSLDDMLKKLKNSNLKIVISRPYYGIGSSQKFVYFLKENCENTRVFRDEYEADFFLFECNMSS